MKERPIIFSADEVRAVLEGRKTQFRRVVKHYLPLGPCDIRNIGNGPEIYAAGGAWMPLKCPFGAPGDVLWVRETWARISANCSNDDVRNGIAYRADQDMYIAWNPSSNMPRWASRLTLTVRSVRVERLHAITDADLFTAEGIDFEDGKTGAWFNEGEHYASAGAPYTVEKYAFMRLWDSRKSNRRYPWASNPWVWVVEFERGDV